MDRSGDDASTVLDNNLTRPHLFNRSPSRTTPTQLKPTMSETTEKIDNLHRPIETLRSDEVEHRVEDAAMTSKMGSGSP